MHIAACMCKPAASLLPVSIPPSQVHQDSLLSWPHFQQCFSSLLLPSALPNISFCFLILDLGTTWNEQKMLWQYCRPLSCSETSRTNYLAPSWSPLSLLSLVIQLCSEVRWGICASWIHLEPHHLIWIILTCTFVVCILHDFVICGAVFSFPFHFSPHMASLCLRLRLRKAWSMDGVMRVPEVLSLEQRRLCTERSNNLLLDQSVQLKKLTTIQADKPFCISLKFAFSLKDFAWNSYQSIYKKCSLGTWRASLSERQFLGQMLHFHLCFGLKTRI